MNDSMKQLYSAEEIPVLEALEKRRRAVCLAAAGVTLAVCVACCLLANTANMSLMEGTAIGVSILGGWFVLYTRKFRLLDTRHELAHLRRMLDGDKTELTGEVQLTGERLRIKNSILVYPVRLADAVRPRLLYASAVRGEEFRKALGGGKKRLAMQLVSNFITAWSEAEAAECAAAGAGTETETAAGASARDAEAESTGAARPAGAGREDV